LRPLNYKVFSAHRFFRHAGMDVNTLTECVHKAVPLGLYAPPRKHLCLGLARRENREGTRLDPSRYRLIILLLRFALPGLATSASGQGACTGQPPLSISIKVRAPQVGVERGPPERDPANVLAYSALRARLRLVAVTTQVQRRN